MSGFLRKIKRRQEEKELEEIRKVYHKKPKSRCPCCHKKSLFMINKDSEVYCILCNKRVK